MNVQISVYFVSFCVGVMFFNIVIIKVNKVILPPLDEK